MKDPAGNGLDAEGVHRGRESVHAGIAAGERIIGGQHRLRVGATEGHGPVVGGRGVAIGVLRCDDEVGSGARNDG